MAQMDASDALGAAHLPRRATRVLSSAGLH